MEKLTKTAEIDGLDLNFEDPKKSSYTRELM